MAASPPPPSPPSPSAADIAVSDEVPGQEGPSSGLAGLAAPTPDVLVTPAGDPWPRPYFFEAGLRKVTPYHFTYNTWCKQRWRGRTLIDVFESEFRDRPGEYYRKAMESGQVLVNAKQAGPEYVLRNGDKVTHTTHRHETPVTAESIGIVHEDDDLLVINKPSGVPVHPAGRYHFNSVVEILKSERGPHFMPHPCHRLDRLTSGIMFIGKNVPASERMGVKIRERSVRKEYLARVIGKFPDGEIVCDRPILQISPKVGLNRVRANGKTAQTVFKRLAYYPPREPRPHGAADAEKMDKLPWIAKQGYSIVRCLPLTGRTHQIRVHLQFLGHPIANDPIYANRRVWGVDLGYNDADGSQATDEDVVSRLSRMGKDEVADAVAYYDELVDDYHKRKAEKLSGKLCDLCDAPLYTDPGQLELSLWLHSLRYEDTLGSWSYVTPLPGWALPPHGMSGPVEVGGMEELVGAASRQLDGGES